MREWDTETLRVMRVFEDITGSEVRDCIIDKENSLIVFLVNPGKMGLAIGKNGENIKIAEKFLRMNIKVYEFAESEEEFIKNLIPARRIEIKNDRAIVYVDPRTKGSIIGKNGSNIRLIRRLVERNSKIKRIELR
jgi:N utilization substance protein A